MSFRYQRGRKSVSVSKRGVKAGYRVGCLIPLVLASAVACAASAPPASKAPATPAPTTDARVRAEIIDSIGVVYCDTAPVAAWCDQLFLTDGKPTVEVTGTSVFVTMQQRTPEALAMSACKAIAAAHFDSDTKDLGFRHVHVRYGSAGTTADCDVVN